MILFKFTKTGGAEFLAHLDILRHIGRTMRRAGVKVGFSQGFNPHPIMKFAHPLGVGISSEAELIEIGFEGDITSGEILSKLSEKMPEGFKLTAAKLSQTKSPFAQLTYAKYEISFYGETPDIEKLMDMKQIITEKKTKSGVKQTDIRPLIKSASVKERKDECTIIEAVLNCGEPNLKPELFVKVFEEIGCGKAEFYKIKRTALLNAEKNPLIKF